MNKSCSCSPGRGTSVVKCSEVNAKVDSSSYVHKNVFKYYKVIGLAGQGRASTCFLAKRKQLPSKRILGYFPWSQRNSQIGARTWPARLAGDSESAAKNKLYVLKYIQQHRHDIEDMVDSWKPFDDELRNEVEILNQIQSHPNIVTMCECFTFDSRTFLVTEYCEGGNLYERAPYSEVSAIRIASKLFAGLAHLHEHGILHRDIKFENILFESCSNHAEIKIIDFGLSKRVTDDEAIVDSSAGTIETMAPEALHGSFARGSDIWSAGVVTYMLLSGMKPFTGSTSTEITNKIASGEYNFTDRSWQKISSVAIGLVSSFLHMTPRMRPSAEIAHGDLLKMERDINNRKHC